LLPLLSLHLASSFPPFVPSFCMILSLQWIIPSLPLVWCDLSVSFVRLNHCNHSDHSVSIDCCNPSSVGVSVVSKASSLSLEFIHCLNCWISAITAVESLRSRRSLFTVLFRFFGRFTVFFFVVTCR
jgi:hypothetical protein